MADPATGGAAPATIAGVAALMTFMPFGVSLEILVLGGCCYFAGSCARTGLALTKRLDGTDPVNLGRSIASLLCTIPLAAVASCIVFLAAHVMGLQADAALGGLLLIMGIRGPEGFQWLVDQLSNVFTRFIPSAPKTPSDKTGGTGP